MMMLLIIQMMKNWKKIVYRLNLVFLFVNSMSKYYSYLVYSVLWKDVNHQLTNTILSSDYIRYWNDYYLNCPLYHMIIPFIIRPSFEEFCNSIVNYSFMNMKYRNNLQIVFLTKQIHVKKLHLSILLILKNPHILK